MTLPMTATARRNARLRAAALATIPLLLFVVAVIPRVWAPDLVPFDPWEAAFVADARTHAGDPLVHVYVYPTWPTLALVDPWLRALPSPVAGWVVVRGLLDALGSAVLYLAVRGLVGPLGAAGAGVLYAVSPVAWAASRDPAGSFGPVLGAAALFAAVRLTERPTLLRGALFGVTLGLLTRSVPLGLLVAALGAVTLASARATWKVAGLTAVGLVLTAGPALFTPLARLVAEPGPENVIVSSPLVASPLIPLSLIVGAVAVLWHANVRTGILFAAVWMGVGLLGGDWVWRTSIRLISGTHVVDLAMAPGFSQFFLAGAFMVAALAISPVRAVRWCGRMCALCAVIVAATSTGLAMRYDAGAETFVAPFTIGGEYSATFQASVARATGSLYLSPSLREMTAVADAVHGVTGRTGANDLVLLMGHVRPSLSRFPFAVLLDNLQTRSVGASMVLPLERETVYLMSAINPDVERPWLAIEAQRPSSSIGVFTPGGADTGARIITIRPRPIADWLARVRAVAEGRFADGSVLVGASRDLRADGTIDLTLYWLLPAAADGRNLGAGAQVLVDGAPPSTQRQAALPEGRIADPLLGSMAAGSATFPAVEARRGGELVVQRVSLAGGVTGGQPPALSVAVFDDRNLPIRTVGGAANLPLPIGP
jgi:hypothetical protein